MDQQLTTPRNELMTGEHKVVVEPWCTENVNECCVKPRRSDDRDGNQAD